MAVHYVLRTSLPDSLDASVEKVLYYRKSVRLFFCGPGFGPQLLASEKSRKFPCHALTAVTLIACGVVTKLSDRLKTFAVPVAIAVVLKLERVNRSSERVSFATFRPVC